MGSLVLIFGAPRRNVGAGDIVALNVNALYEEMVILPTKVGMFAKLDSPWGDKTAYIELHGTVYNHHDWNATLVITVVDSKKASGSLTSPCGMAEGSQQVQTVPPGESTRFLKEVIQLTGWYAIL